MINLDYLFVDGKKFLIDELNNILCNVCICIIDFYKFKIYVIFVYLCVLFFLFGYVINLCLGFCYIWLNIFLIYSFYLKILLFLFLDVVGV